MKKLTAKYNTAVLKKHDSLAYASRENLAADFSLSCKLKTSFESLSKPIKNNLVHE